MQALGNSCVGSLTRVQAGFRLPRQSSGLGVSRLPSLNAKRVVQIRTAVVSQQQEQTERAAVDLSNLPVSVGNGIVETNCDDVFPKSEDVMRDGVLPLRQPGSFPSAITFDEEKLTVAKVEPEYDPLRDGPLRYLGYANECGEAFAAWLPPFGVPLSYAIAIAYVLVDTADKGIRAYKEAGIELDAVPNLSAEVKKNRLVSILAFERTVDTVVWQMLASVICPGYTIHTIVWATHATLVPVEALDGFQTAVASLAPALGVQSDVLVSTLDKSLPTAVGLAAIPFIVHPIDNAIHALLNFTLRPAMRNYICQSGQGQLAQLTMCDESCDIVFAKGPPNE